MIYKNFAYSLVATAPSPATSGTSLVVTASTGTKFPTVPFYATIWPINEMPSTTNAEIVKVTLVSTDTFTIERQQESTSARTVIVGDQIAATITAATAQTIKNQNQVVKTDSYVLTATDDLVICNKTTAMTITLPSAVGLGKVFTIKNINTGTVTVDGESNDTIDGETTQSLNQWDSMTIVDYIANKWIIT